MSNFKNVLVYSKQGNYVTDLDNCEELSDNYNTDKYWYITRLNEDKYILIYETAYEDDGITAWEISPIAAINTILSSGKYWLLDRPMFVDLKEIYNKEVIQEDSPLGLRGIVPVYKHNKLYAAVEVNNLLDEKYYVGTSHYGIAKLLSGEYVITSSSDYNSDNDSAYLVDPKIVFSHIIKTGNEQLLDDPKFKDLKELYDKK